MTVTVSLDHFGQLALEDHVRGTGGSVADTLARALRHYLGDAESGRVAWHMPKPMGVAEPSETIELELTPELSHELHQEARRQRVAPERLALHALMYYLADLDSGRAARRQRAGRQG